MFLPTGDDGDHGVRPIATWVLVALNVFVFAAVEAAGDGTAALDTYGLVPARLELTALFTSMLLHGGLLRLAGSVVLLAIAGDDLEAKLGRATYVAFYVASGVVAGLASAIASARSIVPVATAAGAISGVISAYAVLCSYRRVKILPVGWLGVGRGTLELPAVSAVGVWLAAQAFFALAPGRVAPVAHVAGALAGGGGALLLLALGTVTRDRSPEEQRTDLFHEALEAGALPPRAAGTAEPPPRPDDLPRAIERVIRAARGPVYGSDPSGDPAEHDVIDIIVLVADARSLDRTARIFAAVSGETPFDVRARLNRTGVAGEVASVATARTLVAKLRAAHVAAIAVARAPAPARPVVVRGARVSERGVEGAAGLDGKPVTIPWGRVDAAFAVDDEGGREVAIDVLAAGARYQLRAASRDLASILARALRDRARTPVAIGRTVRRLATAPRDEVGQIPERDLARVLGCLAALARLDPGASPDDDTRPAKGGALTVR